MTLQEATNRAKEIAEINRKEIQKLSADRDDIEYKTCEESAKEYEQLAAWLEELQLYQAIGTIKQCQDAMEKQKAKEKALESYCGFNSYECPSCGTDVNSENCFCHKCGQKLK